MYEPIENFEDEPHENFHGVPLSVSLKKGYFRNFIAFEIHATSNAVFFLFLDFENLMLRICPVDRIVKMQGDD